LRNSAFAFVFVGVLICVGAGADSSIDICSDPHNPSSKIVLNQEVQKVAECRFLTCSAMAAEGELPGDLLFKCSSNYELIYRKIFNRQFNDLLAWWQKLKTREATEKWCEKVDLMLESWIDYLPKGNGCD
jgi:hypothetical protein